MIKYKSNHFDVKDINGKDTIDIKYESVIIFAVDKLRRKVMTIKEFRPVLNKEIINLPAGKMESNDTNILDAAKREFIEETGFELLSPEIYNSFYLSVGIINEKTHYIVGEYEHDLLKRYHQKLDEDEEIRLNMMSFEDFLSLETDQVGVVIGKMLLQQIEV